MESRPRGPKEVSVAAERVGQPRDVTVADGRLRGGGHRNVVLAVGRADGGDTEFDLVTNPVGFLTGGLQLWDPRGVRQIQNQAYGYLWPMGPFFVLGRVVHMPEWAVQRAWWSLLLCLAFFGVVRLAQRLVIGSP